MADDSESIFAKAGFTVPKAAAPSSVAAVKNADPKAGQSIFEAAGFKIPTAAKAAPASPLADNVPTPERFEEGWKAQGSQNPPQSQPSVLKRINDAIDLPAKLLATGSEHAAADIVEHAVAGWQAAKQGLSEIGEGNLWPSQTGVQAPGHVTNVAGETSEVPGLPQYAPGGLLRTAGGALSAVASPVSGSVNALVARPVTELTGNPDIGDRADFVANALIPIRAGAPLATTAGRTAVAENIAGKVATAERTGNALKEVAAEKVAPATASVNALVKTVGPENVPAAVARMREDPLMTLADVSDPVRTAVQGFIDPAQPKVQNLVSGIVKARAAERTDVANSAFTEAMGPTPDVVTMLEILKKRDLGPDAQLKNAREGLDSVMGPPGNAHAEMQALRERQEAAISPQATKGAIDQSIGRPVDPYDELHQMVQQRSEAAAPLYAKALDRPVVWDERLQQFIDDPIVKQGLAQGIRIQRLESLARNEKFNPNDYAIKSFNEAGDPIIGETPNMRTLNVVKKGLDAKVQEMTDPVTGKLSEEGRAVNEVRKAFLSKLDSINDDYKAARQAWAGPSQAHESFNRGLNIFQNRTGSSGVNTTPAALRSWVKDASEGDIEAARIGARSAFDQQMKASGDQTAKAAALANKEVNREKLGILFGQEHANRLVERLNASHEDPIGTGFSRGLDLFQNKTGSAGAESTPEALAAWHKNASPEAQQAARVGARTAIDQQMKSVADPASKGAALATKEVNRQKLEVLFGKEGADKIVNHLTAKFEDPIQNAFESGFDVLKNRSGVEGLHDRPGALAKWMETATPEQVVAKRLGARMDIDQKINSVKNGALAGQTVTKIPYNQEKLRTLFGEKEANRLINVMKNAEDRAFTNAKLLANSKTAETLAGQRAFKVPEVEPFHLGSLTQALLPSALADVAAQYAGLPLGLTGAGLLATGTLAGSLKKGLQVFNKNQALERNYHFARNALATGPAREDTINALLAHPKVVSELKKSTNALVTP